MLLSLIIPCHLSGHNGKPIAIKRKSFQPVYILFTNLKTHSKSTCYENNIKNFIPEWNNRNYGF